MATVDTASFSWTDYDGEHSSTSVNIAELDGTTFDAQATLVQTLRTTMNGLTLVNSDKVSLSDTIFAQLVPVSDPQAQREAKWCVIVADINGNKYKANEIPVANLDLLENNSKYIVKNGLVSVTAAAAAVQAFIDAYEAVALDKFGQAVTVWDVYQVGRNV